MNFYKDIFYSSLKKSGSTTLWLIKIILPVSLVVSFFDYFGILAFLAQFLDPVFIYLGLPGSTAIVYITSVFLPLYAPLAIIISMPITLRELTILALMCQTAHNLPVESAIQAKTGTSFWAMFILRVAVSIAIALILNFFLPEDMGMPLFDATSLETVTSINHLLIQWIKNSIKMGIILFGIILFLNMLYKILEIYHLILKLSKTIEPVLRFFGLSRNVGFLWLIGYIVGLAYGGALMIDQMKEGKVSKTEARSLNYHLAVSHSVLEDNLLFVALGVSYLLILAVRLTAAFAVVWLLRVLTHVTKK